MVTLSSPCPTCGNIEQFSAENCRLVWNEQHPGFSFYQFTCSTTNTRTHLLLDRSVKDRAVRAGVPVEYVTQESQAQEWGEMKPDDILTVDYVLDWTNLLNAMEPDVIAFFAQPNNVTMHDLS